MSNKNALLENYISDFHKYKATMSSLADKELIENVNISAEVYHRLIQRHVILREMIGIENEYHSNNIKFETINKKESVEQQGSKQNDGGDITVENVDNSTEISTSYKIAVADLFVEKALSYLEKDARSYRLNGRILLYSATFFAVIGYFMAIYIYFCHNFIPTENLYTYLTSFTKGFTLFGMNVLVVVISFRYGKALLDQAERLFDRRHALRQGRLFIHLNGGRMNIEELDKAFQWNSMKENAFSGINTEASAPLGKLANDLAGALSSMADAVAKIKGAAGDNKGEAEKKGK